jgi:signal transduction histidine kinase
MTGHRIDRRITPAELCQLFLFESLSPDQLDYLAEHGWIESYAAGETVLVEGEPAEVLVVLVSGTITLSRLVGLDEVELNRTSQVGAYGGAMRSYVKDEPQIYTATLRVVEDATFYVLRGEDFATAITEWFPLAIHLLDGLTIGMRNSQQLVGERQQRLALGDITARLTHELNNPAAAAVRAASELKVRVAGTRHKLAMLAHDEIDKRLLALLVDVQEEAVQCAANAPSLTAIEESELEDQVTEWLEDHGIEGAWELAPIFVAAGSACDFLHKMADVAPPDLLDGAVRWLAYTLETEQLLSEIADSVTRVSSLIGAAREYTNLDRVPYERIDVRQGLKSTLVMLGSKLEGLEVVKEFDADLPPVPAYAAELNQVWTNLIDNATQAMGGAGKLTLRAYAEDGARVVVEIGDNGPGIPADLQKRIFEPFFTTKPVGQGTGLGLDISYRIVVARHGGDLRVESSPGDTRFIVRLPLTERQTG